ncbi:hypothetical protein ACQKEG_11390, partial [Klebsiella quasipneumoniae]
MSWIERIKSNITPTRKASIPEGVWTKCDSCGQVLYRAELERNLEVCPKCDHHMRMSARNRLHSLLDETKRCFNAFDLICRSLGSAGSFADACDGPRKH